jgi:hypothetical protein
VLLAFYSRYPARRAWWELTAAFIARSGGINPRQRVLINQRSAVPIMQPVVA